MSDKTDNCPNCGAKIELSFSPGEKLATGKHIVCRKCNALVWFPFAIGKPTFFEHAADQYGQPRALRC